MTDCLTTNEPNTVVLKHKCTNCMACYNICPSGAIEMKEDKDGFVYPFINEEKCTHCGLCTKKCPALNLEQTKEISERLETPLAYGGYIKDEEIREKSSSGGVFSILSKYVLDKGGYVCGARFTRGGICEHVIVDNWEDLAPLRGSKYVQSNINNCYKEIKNLLEQDKYVLFTGTPCQVAGLYAVLGKDYKKLITVDLLCHGVPSQKVFREYLNEITDGREQEVENFEFRNKRDGWRKPIIKFRIDNSYYYYYYWDTAYIKGFLNNLTIRKSCTDCRFNRLPRQGDFTIGDFWDIDALNKTLDDTKGTSIIFANSTKAVDIFNNINNEFQKCEEFTFDSVKKYNMLQKKSYTHPNRAYFIEKYTKGEYSNLSELITESLEKSDGILCFNFSDTKNNYGSLLTAYALQAKIRKKGYHCVNLLLCDREKAIDAANFDDFRGQYLNETPPSQKTLKSLNKYFRTFICGPDTVWYDFDNFGTHFNNYKFAFANFSKNICSYAASFGSTKLLKFIRREKFTRLYNQSEINETKRILKRFSHISVREDSGVKICKDNFDIQATHVLDSVFLLSSDDWEKILPKNSKHTRFARYILNWGTAPKECIDYINNFEDVNFLYDGINYNDVWSKKQIQYSSQLPKIEEWIEGIANCDVFLTDSFHGMCFAIIFNKQFILFKSMGGEFFTRLDSLMKMLGIPDRTANSVEDIKRLLNEPIDYDKVNAKLQEHLKTSEEFLEKILYSHEHPDPVRGYMESLELLVEENSQKVTARIEQNFNEKLNKKEDKKPSKKTPVKEKWYFLGIHIFKKALLNGEQWFYLFGIPFIKEVKKEHNTYYKLFGLIRVLKKAVRG